MQGFHVGLPFLKLSLNPSTQKHNGKAAKTCSVKCAWDEMNDKRKGKDKTIDHSLTKNNIWLTGSSEMDMEQVIQTEIDRINAIRAESGKRKMRCDAVSAIEMIQKPPMDIMQELTPEEQLRMLRTSDEVLEELLHEWAPAWKTLATVIHFDEMGGKSPHPHKIVMPIGTDKDGCPVLNAKKDFNLSFFTFINRNYPERMRQKGYPVLDCEVFEDMTPEEKAVHQEKKKDYGLESYEFKKKKVEEQNATIEQNEGIIGDQKAKISEQEKKLEQQKNENRNLEIQILSKQEVKTLPKPDSTLLGDYYKVPRKDYNNLLATAKQAELILEQQKAAEASVAVKEQALARREAELERKHKLPMKERMELLKLRVLEKSVRWILSQISDDNPLHRWLEKALDGQDLTKTNNERSEHRKLIKEIL